MIGASIGLTFAVSLMLAPPLYRAIGMGGLFSLVGVLAIAAIAVTVFLVPPQPAIGASHDSGASLGEILRDVELLRLNIGIFVLHMVQVAMFVVVPLALVRGGLDLEAHWKVYLPVVLVSFALMMPPILFAERRGKLKQLFLAAIIIMLGGVLALRNLPVAQYPDVAPPTISIAATYPGASAKAVEDTVTQVIERQLTGLDGLDYTNSTSSSNGSTSINLTFRPGTDPDIAQVQVQNKLSLATPFLPQDVQRQGVTVSKASSGFLLITAFPSVLVIVLISSAALPVLLDAAAERDRAERLGKEAGTNTFDPIVTQIRNSLDPIEKKSIYQGKVVADRSPVLVPRDVYCEHAHALGDSGGGKTGLFLCPITEQLVDFGDCSVIVLDLKADSLELLGSLQASVERVRKKSGMPMPLQVFSNQNHRHTVAFNPMTQPFWNRFDLLTRTDILCAANGLNYGTDYGQGYYSSANAAIVFHAMKTFPHISSFAELADCIGTVVTTAKRQDLHPEIRKAGIHVHEVMKRLAACEALNVTSATLQPPEVQENAIDLTRFFQEPNFLYCHLPSTLSPSGAPEIARLFTYLLLAASTQTERKCQVFLVIDEFQRMVANNLQYMLQLARSMGVGIVLANQSMQDLKQGGTNLIPAIEANCRLRQWFSVSSVEDQERLMQISGKTIDHSVSRTNSVNAEGKSSSSISATEQVVDRLTINDILLTNDHPHRSILRVGRGSGYAQFGGMPVIIESDFHISESEYLRRKNMPWPQGRGSFVPKSETYSTSKTVAPSEAADESDLWTEQVVGAASSTPLTPELESQLTSLFEALRQDVSSKSKPTSRRRRQDP